MHVHPSDVVLRSYILSELQSESSAAMFLERHVDDCPQCLRRIVSLAQVDAPELFDMIEDMWAKIRAKTDAAR